MINCHTFSLSMQIAFSGMGPFGFAGTFLNTPVEEFKTYLNGSFANHLTEDGYNVLWNCIQNIWLVGLVIGLLLSPIMNDRFGRRVGLLSGNSVNLLMAIVQWASVHFGFPPLLLIGRFFSAIATAITFQSVVLYLQEFPPSVHRGISSYTADITFSFCCFVGMTLGTEQLLGGNLSLLMGVQILLCTLSVLSTFRMHESPKFLLMRSSNEEAVLGSIRFFHGSDKIESTDQFLQELREECRQDASSAHSFKDSAVVFTDPALRKTILLGLAATQMTIPLWTLLFNSTDLLLDLNASKFVSQWTSSGIVICYFLGCIIGCFLVDKLGRRTLFIPCSAISTACVAVVAIAFYFQPVISHVEFVAVAALLLNGLIFGIGMASIAWFIAPELSPLRYRSLIQSIVAVLNMVQTAVFTFSVMPLYRTFGPWVFLILFCFVMTLCTIFLYFELPETAGRPIVDITEDVRNGSHNKSRIRPKTEVPSI